MALAEGHALERPPPAGLIDVSLSWGMRELRSRALSAGEWLSELDPNDGIAVPYLRRCERDWSVAARRGRTTTAL